MERFPFVSLMVMSILTFASLLCFVLLSIHILLTIPSSFSFLPSFLPYLTIHTIIIITASLIRPINEKTRVRIAKDMSVLEQLCSDYTPLLLESNKASKGVSAPGRESLVCPVMREFTAFRKFIFEQNRCVCVCVSWDHYYYLPMTCRGGGYDDDGDEYTNLLQSLLPTAFYSYLLHLSPSYSISLPSLSHFTFSSTTINSNSTSAVSPQKGGSTSGSESVVDLPTLDTLLQLSYIHDLRPSTVLQYIISAGASYIYSPHCCNCFVCCCCCC